jgi:gamma-glutamyltranspeptidase/glutathione hydrolase
MAGGGTAADGAIAANAVLAVVAPETCGPGGDLFALIHRPGLGEPDALNASGRAGSGAVAAHLRDRGMTEMPPRSPSSITVPGCVDGWEALLARHGRLGLDAVLEPAIAIAEDGFPVSAELSGSLEAYHELLAGQGSADSLYPAGRPPKPGETLRRPRLAATLSETASGGRDAFYGGAAGAAITAATNQVISRDDLAVTQAEWVTPLGAEVFDRKAWTMPPNSQGYLTLATLAIFEMLDPPLDPGDPRFQHALVEAYRSVAWERDSLVSDPATLPVVAESLLSTSRLSERAAHIDPARARRWPPPAPAPGGTAYLCTRDGEGMAVSLIQSNFWGIGSGISAGDTGVWLHNRGDGFTLEPHHPNELNPGKRPLHTLSPTLWTRDGALDLLLGTRGGDYQPQLLAQVAAHLFRGELCLADAQTFPRWHLADFGPGSSSTLLVEDRFSERTLEGMRQRGHDVTATDRWMLRWGPVSAIGVTETVTGAADPRITTSSVAAR